MKCATCGKSESEGSQFCGNCGARLGSDTSLGGEKLPMVKFPEAVRRGFKNYGNFKGRATRAEYWWWALFVVVADVILTIVDMAIGSYASSTGLLSGLFGIATIIPGLALGARRLHDIDKSAWWLLMWFGFFLIVPGIVLIVWTVQRGNAYPNKHGPDPCQATSQ
jgi:uncharacterized membrane protein YhaH (DUF805 family)